MALEETAVAVTRVSTIEYNIMVYTNFFHVDKTRVLITDVRRVQIIVIERYQLLAFGVFGICHSELVTPTITILNFINFVS